LGDFLASFVDVAGKIETMLPRNRAEGGIRQRRRGLVVCKSLPEHGGVIELDNRIGLAPH
jgi:hypothetical protein